MYFGPKYGTEVCPASTCGTPCLYRSMYGTEVCMGRSIYVCTSGPKYGTEVCPASTYGTEVCPASTCGTPCLYRSMYGPKYVRDRSMYGPKYICMYFGTEVWDRSMPCLYMWDALPLPKYVC